MLPSFPREREPSVVALPPFPREREPRVAGLPTGRGDVGRRSNTLRELALDRRPRIPSRPRLANCHCAVPSRLVTVRYRHDSLSPALVIPAKAGTQRRRGDIASFEPRHWIPAFARMTAASSFPRKRTPRREPSVVRGLKTLLPAFAGITYTDCDHDDRHPLRIATACATPRSLRRLRAGHPFRHRGSS